MDLQSATRARPGYDHLPTGHLDPDPALTAESPGRPRAGRFLGIYLNDHLAGSTAGVRLARRLAKRHHTLTAGPTLASISREIDEDRAAFLAILERLGVPRRLYKITIGWVAELLARAKTNGRALRRSPLSTVVELETLRLGVEGKHLAWLTLRTVAHHDPELDLDTTQLDTLADRAADQAKRLEELRTAAVRDALSRLPTEPAAW
jgi:hypothetical protein